MPQYETKYQQWEKKYSSPALKILTKYTQLAPDVIMTTERLWAGITFCLELKLCQELCYFECLTKLEFHIVCMYTRMTCHNS